MSSTGKAPVSRQHGAGWACRVALLECRTSSCAVLVLHSRAPSDMQQAPLSACAVASNGAAHDLGHRRKLGCKQADGTSVHGFRALPAALTSQQHPLVAAPAAKRAENVARSATSSSLSAITAWKPVLDQRARCDRRPRERSGKVVTAIEFLHELLQHACAVEARDRRLCTPSSNVVCCL